MAKKTTWINRGDGVLENINLPLRYRVKKEPTCQMADTTLYDPKLYDDWVASWKTIGHTKPSPEVERIRSLFFEFCPDGQKHNYRVVPGESYMCDTMYKCTRCGKKMRQDSSD